MRNAEKMYDAVVIGSGPGGYECARRVAELGWEVIIVEKDKLGGTCTNYGCIPTKALHASASFYSNLKNAKRLGFEISPVKVNLESLYERKNRIVKIMCKGVEKILKDSSVEIINGEAKIKDKNTVIVD